MKLTTKQIKEILFGAVEVIEEAGVLSPYKCTAPIRKAWYSLREALGIRSEASTGIRLDFVTDGEEVTFTLMGKTFDLLIDGLLADRFAGSHEPEDFSVTLDGDLHRITLIFPSHDGYIGKLCGMEVPDGATVTPHKYDKKFLFLGDSITQGWNSGIDSLSYAWRTSLHFNADCIIHGVGGGIFHLPVFESPVDFDPDLVFIAFGTNDFGYYKTLEDLQKATAEYLDLAVAAYGSEKIRGITPIWRYDTWVKPMGTFDECIDVIRTEYEKRGIVVIDGLSLVPHNRDFFADALHPNALGFSMYAENLIKALNG